MNRQGVRQQAKQQALPADLRGIGAVTCTLLLLAGAALPGWRWLQGLAPTPWQLAICALPPTLGLAAMAAATPPRQTLVHLFACLLMLPLLLLIWGSSLPAPPEATPADEPSYWLFALVYAGTQLLCLLAFVRWVGRRA
ncbi:hypothetical protein [Paucibacter sp. M5-1]|uniref:hypothetical protein n=1 Tax=Paucibacter sp. M5-1 TaxID=3015998 RepID=UPI0022B90CBF|nr:hypothetical protein [Paucibacter sp. M5-1]MCZ7880242.1 hypothetical protein [Paucibacter sp. M5-1]